MIKHIQRGQASPKGAKHTPVSFVYIILFLLLAAYASYWITFNSDGAATLTAQPTTEQSPKADGLSAKSAQAISLAHINAALEKAAIPPERLAEYHTIEEVFLSTANPLVTVKSRLETYQRGTYPNLNRKLSSVSGEPLDSPLMPYDKMSRREKLLLYSDWAGSTTRDIPVYYEIINRMNEADIQALAGYGMLDALWNEGDVNRLVSIYQKSGRDRAMLTASLANEWLPGFISPITMGFFEPWHKEWAAGHGYVFEVAEANERKRVVDVIVALQLEHGLPIADLRPAYPASVRPALEPNDLPDTMDYYKFFYYRVYGEKPDRILAEGIMQVESFQARQARWQPQPLRQ